MKLKLYSNKNILISDKSDKISKKNQVKLGNKSNQKSSTTKTFYEIQTKTYYRYRPWNFLFKSSIQ